MKLKHILALNDKCDSICVVDEDGISLSWYDGRDTISKCLYNLDVNSIFIGSLPTDGSPCICVEVYDEDYNEEKGY